VKAKRRIYVAYTSIDERGSSEGYGSENGRMDFVFPRLDSSDGGALELAKCVCVCVCRKSLDLEDEILVSRRGPDFGVRPVVLLRRHMQSHTMCPP